MTTAPSFLSVTMTASTTSSVPVSFSHEVSRDPDARAFERARLHVAAHAVMALCEAAVLGAIWGALTELFPTRVRDSGVGISFNIAGVLVGGSAPYIATWLIQQTGDKCSPAYFLMAVGAVTLLTLFTVPETARRKMLE
jgi:MFS family permease